jgi:hypothetical protein
MVADCQLPIANFQASSESANRQLASEIGNCFTVCHGALRVCASIKETR